MKGEEKPVTVQTTVRLLEGTKERLEHAARIKRKPMNQIVEESLDAWFRANGLIERYVVRVLKGHVVLMKLTGEATTLLDMEVMNGVPLQQVADRYAVQLQRPVLVEDEGEQQ